MPLPPCRKALTLALLLAIPILSVFAQKNFIDGYIVTKNKDSLRGQIDFRDWGVTPDHIVFRQGETGKADKYAAADLAAFGVNEQRYESHTVHVFPYSGTPEGLSSEDEIGAPYDTTIFLQVLTSGKMTLWEERTPDGTNYYFISGKSGKPEQLRVITKVFTTQGVTKIDQVDLYHNQLTYMLQDCDAAARRVQNTDYKANSLEKLIFAYNNCGKDTVEQRRDRGRVRVFPIAGYMSSKIRFTGDDPAAHQQYPSSSSLVAGAGALFIVPHNRQQLSFVTDVVWQHFHSVSDAAPENVYINETGHIDYSLLKVEVLFRYRYPTDGIRPFLEGGVANSLALGLNCYESYVDRLDNSTYTSPLFNGSLHRYQEGWILGAGLSGKRWTIEGRFEASSGISEVTNVGSPVKTWYVLASFAL